MTLEITQAGSLAADKTHRALRKARLRLRERSAARGFAHSSTQPLSRGQLLSDKDRAWFTGERIMEKGKGILCCSSGAGVGLSGENPNIRPRKSYGFVSHHRGSSQALYTTSFIHLRQHMKRSLRRPWCSIWMLCEGFWVEGTSWGQCRRCGLVPSSPEQVQESPVSIIWCLCTPPLQFWVCLLDKTEKK